MRPCWNVSPMASGANCRHWPVSTARRQTCWPTCSACPERAGSTGPGPSWAAGWTPPLRAYTALAGLTALNPLTVVYFGALVLNRQAAGAFTASQAGIFVASVFAASASWQLLLAAGGALLGGW